MRAFLARLREILAGKVSDGDLSKEDFDSAVRAAIGHAGGKATAYRRRVAAEGDKQSGVMVALFLDDDTAKALAIPGGEPPEDLHITLAYCGKMDDHDSITLARLVAAVHDLVTVSPPLHGKVGGVGVFLPGDGSDGKECVVALPDVPYLDKFREELVSRINHISTANGKLVSADHGYTPHITLRYRDAGSDESLPRVPALDLHFKSVVVALGDSHLEMNLSDLALANRVYRDGAIDFGAACANDGGLFRLFFEIPPTFQAAEPPEWMPLLPKPGVYEHQKWGKISVTAERNKHFVDGLNGGVYQKQVPVDAEHQTKLSGALGWMTAARVNEDGSAHVRVDWTDRGRDMIRENRFKYVSPEWFEEWQDPAPQGKKHRDVLVGAALTTRPFFKDGSLLPLIASERGVSVAPYDVFSFPVAIEAAGQRPDPEVRMTVAEKIDTDQRVTLQLSDEAQEQMRSLTEQLEEANTERATLKSMVEQQAAQIKTAGENIAAMQRSERLRRFSDEVSGRQEGGVRWAGEPDKNVAVLEHIATSAGEDSDVFKSYIEQQRAIGKQMSESGLFKEIGSSGGDNKPGGGTAWDQVQAEAKKFVEDGKAATFEQGVALVASTNQELMGRYRSETRVVDNTAK